MSQQRAIREHPLLLDAAQVRAVLSGQLCVMRVAITARNSCVDGPGRGTAKPNLADETVFVDRGPSPAGNSGPYLHAPDPILGTTHRVYPIWQVGDRLWGRETFAIESTQEYSGERGILPIDGRPMRGIEGGEGGSYHLIPRYRATEPDTLLMVVDADTPEEGMRWTPSVQMPRWASRILLDVVEVDAERLQDISEGGAISDGWVPGQAGNPGNGGPFDWFRQQWDRRAPKGASWADNPWVWVIKASCSKRQRA